jgi:4-amino-4-deoxy-L-arabinose transferase-like glycosyltransferase
VLPGVWDQFSYDGLARRLLGGYGLTFGTDWWPLTRAGEPTAHWSYLYTLYLTGIYALFGAHPLVARVIQAAIAGVLAPWLVYRLGCRTFGSSAGLVAAGLVAIYGYFVYYAGALMTETFYILAILWSLDLAIQIAEGPAPETSVSRPRSGVAFRTVKPWILLGVALGITGLFRQVGLLFAPILFAWLFWVKVRRGRRDAPHTAGRWHATLGGLVLTSVVIIVLIAPWTVRNYIAFGRFVPLNTNSGYALFWANHPIYGTTFIPILPNGTYQALIPTELRGLDEAALDQALLREGLGFVVDDPMRFVKLSASRLVDYFTFWPSPDSGELSNLARFLSFGVCLPFMIYGLILAAMGLPTSGSVRNRRAIALLYLFVMSYSLVHILTWALIRYRLPVDAVLMPFAGFAIVDIVERWTHRREFAVRRTTTITPHEGGIRPTAQG